MKQAVHRGATVKAANDAPPGAKVQENARSVPRGVLSSGLEKTRVRARPGNRGHSRSAASKGRGANNRRAQKAAGNAPPGLRENAHSVPRGALSRKGEGASEAGKPRSFGKPGFKGPRREASGRGAGGEHAPPGLRRTRTAPKRPWKRRGGERGGETEVIREARL